MMFFGRAFDLFKLKAGKLRFSAGRGRAKCTRRDPATANAYEPRGFLLLDPRPSRHFSLRPLVVWGRRIRLARDRLLKLLATVLPCEFCGCPVWPQRLSTHLCPGLYTRMVEEAAWREAEDEQRQRDSWREL